MHRTLDRSMNRAALAAIAILAAAPAARAQAVEYYNITIDASTVQPVGTGFIPSTSSGDVIILAQGNEVSGPTSSHFDSGWSDASGRVRLDRVGQPIMSGMPHGALVGGFTTNIANYRYVGEMGSFHLLPAHVGHEFRLALNMSSGDLALLQGSVTATVIFIPTGSADVSRVVFDSSTTNTLATGLIAANEDQFIVLPYGALTPTAPGGSTYTGSAFGTEGLISYSPAGLPRPQGPYGTVLGTFNGGASGAFHIGNGGTFYAQPADLGLELSIMLNLPSADLPGLDGSIAVNVIRVSYSFSAVSEPSNVGLHRLSSGPNPMREASTLRFELPSSSGALLRIADVSGRWVRTLVDQPLVAGAQSVQWDGRDDHGRELPAGTYFCQLSTAEGSSTARVVVTR